MPLVALGCSCDRPRRRHQRKRSLRCVLLPPRGCARCRDRRWVRRRDARRRGSPRQLSTRHRKRHCPRPGSPPAAVRHRAIDPPRPAVEAVEAAGQEVGPILRAHGNRERDRRRRGQFACQFLRQRGPHDADRVGSSDDAIQGLGRQPLLRWHGLEHEGEGPVVAPHDDADPALGRRQLERGERQTDINLNESVGHRCATFCHSPVKFLKIHTAESFKLTMLRPLPSQRWRERAGNRTPQKPTSDGSRTFRARPAEPSIVWSSGITASSCGSWPGVI